MGLNERVLLLPLVLMMVGGLVISVQANLKPRVSPHFDDYWYEYKARHNKEYPVQKELQRRAIWERNLVKIYDHNLKASAGHYEYFLGDNHLADLSNEEYNKEMVRLTPSRSRRISDEDMVQAVLKNPRCVPKALDWRDRGFVTKPQNQKNCGSCYAYTIAGTVSGQLFRRTGKVTELSEQQLVDCSTQTGNLGCDGGSLRNTLRYLDRANGIMSEESYPYEAKQGACKYQKRMSVTNITSWAILPARDEKELQIAVATIGPIAASVNASPRTFQLYHSGVYDDPACTSDVVNHAMLIVGYTEDAWILKNWWGSKWGENGYMRMKKGKNRCGVANFAAYVKI